MVNSTSTPKLRDSCDACASSKVRCHKQKPSCARCVKRGETCVYLATKRAGRRFDSNPRPVDSSQLSPTATSTSNLDRFDLDVWLKTNDVEVNNNGDNINTSNASTHAGVSSATSSEGSGSDDIFLSQFLSSTGSSIETPRFSLQNTASTPSVYDMLFMPNQISAVSPPTTTPESLNLDTGLFSPSNLNIDLADHLLWNPSVPDPIPIEEVHDRSLPLTSPSTPPDNCLTRATHMLQQQFHQQANMGRPSSSCALSEQDHKPDTPVPLLDTIIETNKQMIDAVGSMLQCPCFHDNYLLTILSLIVFKIIDSYGTAAVTSEAREPEPDPLQEDALYMGAQQVLGELHRVQRLVHQISAKIKSQVDVEGHRAKSNFATSGNEFHAPVSLPFSTVMPDQLEGEMRKRLKTLSLGLAAYLRRD
ncbi:unnamed protein product [Periconia digitata]|uniref:Zn(2)-C6 fungal-type domain-containing protein n=1 Tax=Periconia digitata TaxID=1303443 RepID=A0A9W4XKL9_9PLEO|nr:unnamed protein product [Periconia digitata]